MHAKTVTGLIHRYPGGLNNGTEPVINQRGKER